MLVGFCRTSENGTVTSASRGTRLLELRAILNQSFTNVPSSKALSGYFEQFGKVCQVIRFRKSPDATIVFVEVEDALRAQSVREHVVNGFRFETIGPAE